MWVLLEVASHRFMATTDSMRTNRPIHTFPALGLLLGLASTAAGQGQFSTGPLAFTPGSFSFDLQSSPGKQQLRMKRPGFKSSLVDFSAPAGRPRYDLAADFSKLTGNNKPLGDVDVDAMSVGLDWVLADDDGNVRVFNQRWGAITFGLRRGSKGMPRSTVRKESDRFSDLFYHIPKDSNLQDTPGPRPGPSSMAGRTMRALDRSELRAGARRDEMDAVDLHMNLYRMHDRIFDRVLPWVQRRPRFYFSVSRATAGNIPPGWSPHKSGAVVFYREWVRFPGVWTAPKVFLDYRKLISHPRAKDFDILAIAIDDRAQYMLLSIVDHNKKTYINPFLFLNFGTDAPILVTYGGAEPVSKEAELEDTDTVDALCVLDPTHIGFTSGVHPIAYTMGTPMAQQQPWITTDGSASGSAFVDSCGKDRWTLHHFLSGWQPSGEGDGYTLWSAQDSNGQFSIPARRNANPQCPGSPEQRVFPCMPTAPSHLMFSLHWLVAGPTIFLDIAEAYPIGMITP